MNDLIRISCQNDAGAPALRTRSNVFSYADLDGRIDEFAERLRRDGVSAGTRIAYHAATCVDYIIAFWATLRLGASFCPVNPRWPVSTTEEAAEHILAARLYREVETGRLSRIELPDRSSLPAANATSLAGPATIIFSSGSSGAPKAIAHTLEAHIASAAGANSNMPLRAADSWLLSLPLFHVAGVAILFRCALAGSCVCVPERHGRLEASVRELCPSHLSVIPTQLRQLLSDFGRAPDYVQGVLLGGAPLPEKLIEDAIREEWPIVTSYGMTETASQITATQPRLSGDDRIDLHDALQTAGRCLADSEIMVTADDEICVRGNTLFMGYVHRETVVPHLDAEGWFHTKDRGRIDHGGRLHVLGRMDNMFISGGENIYPEEVEQCLVSLANVAQAVVVPVANSKYGHRPAAFVQTIDGTASDEQLWRRELALHLPKFKIPDFFFSWPKQTGLKPDRRQLGKIASQLTPPPNEFET